MFSPRLLYASIDSSEIDRGPDENNRPYVALFYFLYIIVIAFFIVNIFVGFVVVTFQSESQHSVFSKNQVSISRDSLKNKSNAAKMSGVCVARKTRVKSGTKEQTPEEGDQIHGLGGDMRHGQ